MLPGQQQAAGQGQQYAPNAGVTYTCGDCGHENVIKLGDVIRCAAGPAFLECMVSSSMQLPLRALGSMCCYIMLAALAEALALHTCGAPGAEACASCPWPRNAHAS